MKDSIDDLASGMHNYHPNHGKVINKTNRDKGIGAQWYEYEDGSVKTYLQLLYEKQRSNKK